ncbi:hypothetical protein ACGFYQ_11380 [Streptomyces sp. NPDC048258]|uniref:hypothetical protein n=1 Tax=Streptomyces sp. NPDC048258 TaxID=3365527 RepID=UPI0037150350
MSMPPPQHSPGPYGSPPPPHHPHQPHQPPYAGQGPWGYPPVGPPPRKDRTGMVIGIVIAVLAGLGVAGFAVNRLSEAGAVASGAGFPKAEYKLTVPKTLLNGEYELAQDLSQTQGKEAVKGGYDPKIRNPEPAVGQYTADSPKGMGVLVISGMYGQFKDPASARRKMLSGAADAEGASMAVPAKDITPAGSGITLSCQVLTTTEDGARTTVPMCAWADENTGAAVGVITPESASQAPASVDLAKVAETTLKVRAEARTPIG